MSNFLKDHPIYTEVDKSSNEKVDLETITLGSSKRLNWICSSNHTWSAEVRYRTRSKSPHGCPYCSGQKFETGINDFSISHPQLAASMVFPEQAANTSRGSKTKVLWKCENNHTWEASPAQRIRQKNCPKCYKEKILTLSETHPLLAEELTHPEIGDSISKGSNKTVSWNCPQGHTWETSPKKRVQGAGCCYCSGRKILVGFNDLKTTDPEISNYWSDSNSLTPESYTRGSSKLVSWKCLKVESHPDWKARVDSLTLKNTGCPECALENKSSKAEKELFNYIKSLLPGSKVYSSYRSLIKYELDIYIPDKKVAIEYNGVHWHSDNFVDKNYHYLKYIACKDKDVQLIQIWEDDWNRNPELVKRVLSKKIGVSQEENVYGRNSSLKLISKDEAEKFLVINHLQGFSSGSYYIGLYDKRNVDALLAVLVLKKEPGTNGNTLNIIRYATALNVPGGFTKMLKFAEDKYKPDKFITFSDNTVSNGELYSNNGFILDKELAPDYMYLINGVRKHKFGFRKKAFSIREDLIFEENKTEKELAQLNNISRIWDAGKIRWVKNLIL